MLAKELSHCGKHQETYVSRKVRGLLTVRVNVVGLLYMTLQVPYLVDETVHELSRGGCVGNHKHGSPAPVIGVAQPLIDIARREVVMRHGVVKP